MGNINPYIYILFLLLYPIGSNRMGFLFIAFSLGLIIDLFLDSGGINAAASLSVAYMRPIFLKFSFGAAYDYQSVKLNTAEALPRLTYFALMIFIHHFILFTLIYFDSSKFKMIIYNTLVNSGFTLILVLLLNTLFSSKKS
ncbi:MAG: rod shape-determining protein MreD [Bacteroidota bacterium]|nr:rod shape-determining protein MreD [Bacteroidota bacterium]